MFNLIQEDRFFEFKYNIKRNVMLLNGIKG
jgi:hypothetical protein